MFGGKNRDDVEDGRELNTILGKGSVIEGKISIKNSVRVDGRIVGEISSTGTITIGEKGEIEGNVNATKAVVGGKVKGRINAAVKAILEAHSVLIGDLKTAKLTIDEGAMFEGRCLMPDEEGKPTNNSKNESKKGEKQSAGPSQIVSHDINSQSKGPSGG